jgi:hypothetical protein
VFLINVDVRVLMIGLEALPAQIERFLFLSTAGLAYRGCSFGFERGKIRKAEGTILLFIGFKGDVDVAAGCEKDPALLSPSFLLHFI